MMNEIEYFFIVIEFIEVFQALEKLYAFCVHL